jgi:murein DD-endopeptidase MepM/ murein hydrolase activator NlpD
MIRRCPTPSRLVPWVLVGAMVLSPMATAGAADGDPRAALDRTRDDRAARTADLDALNASELELQEELFRLTIEVNGQQEQVAAARAAVTAADATVDGAVAELSATTAAIEELKRQIVESAVTSFVSPGDNSLLTMLESEDPAEAGRKQAFLDEVVARDSSLVDQLTVAEARQVTARRAAEAAQRAAEERRAETEARLGDLEASLTAQATLTAALDLRQAEVLLEIELLAAAEAQLSAAIGEGMAQVAASGAGAAAPSTVASAAGAGSVTGGGCVWPSKGTVTSEYGSRWGRLHAGIDIAAPTGTPIWAAKAGTVVVAGSQGGYGNTVVVDHGGGMTTLYGHQSRIAARTGQQVSQGQLIGYVGNTGNSTGPHLHFETRYGGSARNPRGCLR